MEDRRFVTGQVVLNKYRIDRMIGEGGMARVFVARHLQLDELVAIKMLMPQTLENSEAVIRFQREARAAIKIKSEHVVRIMDVTELESGEPLMVMEYLEGVDLSELIRERGALPHETAVDLVLQACEAMAEAHTLGIIHRDLKPANLFLTRRKDGSDCVKVLDFGISKISKRGSNGVAPDMTSTQAVMGSPLYMPPEQMSASKNVDVRSDLWSLGAVLHEMLSGRPPFDGESITQLVASIMVAPPTPIRSARPDVPEDLERVILRCLEKDKEGRWPDVASLALALAPFGSASATQSATVIARMVELSGGVSGCADTVARVSLASAPENDALGGRQLVAGQHVEQAATDDVSADPVEKVEPGAAAPVRPRAEGVERGVTAEAHGGAGQTAASWGNTRPTKRSGGRSVAWIGGSALVILVGFVALWLGTRGASAPVSSGVVQSASVLAIDAASVPKENGVEKPPAGVMANATASTEEDETVPSRPERRHDTTPRSVRPAASQSARLTPPAPSTSSKKPAPSPTTTLPPKVAPPPTRGSKGLDLFSDTH